MVSLVSFHLDKENMHCIKKEKVECKALKPL